MVPAAESSSSNLLLYVLVGVGILVVLVAIGLAVWMSKRKAAQPQGHAPQYGMPPGQPMPPSFPQSNPQPNPQPQSPGWYADPRRHARLRWFDGNQWTANTQE